MTVTLSWITPDAEGVILDHARVSASPDQPNTGGRLLGYLIRHKHWSPFEQANMAVRIETTRDISRQIIRHRSLTVQEFSQRYSSAPDSATLRAARLQDLDDRQQSIFTDDDALHEWWTDAQFSVWNSARAAYEEALKRGIAKEVARVLLPEGMTPTVLFVNGTIRSWLHFIEVRAVEAGAQREIAQIADEVADLLRQHLPVTMEAWNGRAS